MTQLTDEDWAEAMALVDKYEDLYFSGSEDAEVANFAIMFFIAYYLKQMPGSQSIIDKVKDGIPDDD